MDDEIDIMVEEIENERRLLYKLIHKNCSNQKVLEQSQKMDKLLNKFMKKMK